MIDKWSKICYFRQSNRLNYLYNNSKHLSAVCRDGRQRIFIYNNLNK